MDLFERIPENSSIFRDEVVLSFDYVPKLIPYREAQQRKIASCIKPLFYHRNGKNLMVFGQPGVGKTVACRHVLRELEEKTDKIIPIYINCWKRNTTFKILLEMCNQLNFAFVQNKRGDELFDIVKQIVNKKSAVIVLDEIDKLEDSNILYSILEDVYRKSVVLIANKKEWIDEVDARIGSRLMAESIEFKPYAEHEVYGILKERIKYAFQPSVWSEPAFRSIVRKTTELGDIRVGLFLMREAGNIAEDAHAKRISIEHVDEALQSLREFARRDEQLSKLDQLIVQKVRESPGINIGKLYETFMKDFTYKSFQRKIAALIKAGFFRAEKKVGGAGGSTTLLYPAATKSLNDFC